MVLPGCQEERGKGSSWLIGGDVRGFFLADKRRGEKVLPGRHEESRRILPG